MAAKLSYLLKKYPEQLVPISIDDTRYMFNYQPDEGLVYYYDQDGEQAPISIDLADKMFPGTHIIARNMD